MKVSFIIAFITLLIGLISFVFHSFNKKKSFFLVGTLGALSSFLTLTVYNILRAISVSFDPGKFFQDPYSLLAWTVLLVYFIAEYRSKIKILSGFVMPIPFLLLFMQSFNFSSIDDPMPSGTLENPAVVGTHVALLIVSYALFFVAFAEAIVYIIKARGIKKVKLNDELPALKTIEKVLVSSFNSSWAFMTCGIILVFITVIKSGHSNLDMKIILGSLTWVIHTILFLLFNFKKITTRHLARAITFLLLFVLAFVLVVDFNSAPVKEKSPSVIEGEK